MSYDEPPTDIAALGDDNGDQEDSDPHVRLDRLQLAAHGKQIGELTSTVAELFALVRKVARKLGVKVTS